MNAHVHLCADGLSEDGWSGSLRRALDTFRVERHSADIENSEKTCGLLEITSAIVYENSGDGAQ